MTNNTISNAYVNNDSVVHSYCCNDKVTNASVSTYNSIKSDIDSLQSFVKKVADKIGFEADVECEVELEDTPVYPVYIKKDGSTTIVYWDDGTSTAVKACKDDPVSDYSAFCAALAKKVYGSNCNVHRMIHKFSEENIKKKKAAEKEKIRNEQLKREKIQHDRKVRKLAKRLHLMDEAYDYMQKKGMI